MASAAFRRSQATETRCILLSDCDVRWNPAEVKALACPFRIIDNRAAIFHDARRNPLGNVSAGAIIIVSIHFEKC